MGEHTEHFSGAVLPVFELMPTVFWLAGEPSGDLQAAQVARALKVLRPDVAQVGWGGVHLESAGVRLLRNLD